MKSFDAVVIGGGPAGLTAALYLVRSGVSTALVEKSSHGGQVLSTSEIENYPGFPKGVKGWELADLFSAHLEDYPVTRIRGNIISMETSTEPGAPNRLFFDEDGETVEAKALIIATGAQHRKLGAPGETRLTGKGVSYCAVCDGNFYRGQEVAVVGGGNSALEEAIYLSRIVSKVYIIHRREGFRACKHFQDKVQSMSDTIELVTSHVVEELQGEDSLEGVLVKHVHTGETRVLPVQGAFIYVGMDPGSGFFPATLNVDQKGFIHTDTEMVTNLPGVFAAGDIRVKNCRQISSAVGDGATAATAALSYLEQFNA